jgi:hypothetical protein
MSLRALALDWSLDGSAGIAFLVLCVAAGGVYASAAAIGSRRDRRHRRWPRRRTACFCAGLALLAVDLYSGIGTQTDVRLSAHMLEHMIMWLLVARCWRRAHRSGWPCSPWAGTGGAPWRAGCTRGPWPG